MRPFASRRLPGRVARSYLTTACGWQTIWRTLANHGECSRRRWPAV